MRILAGLRRFLLVGLAVILTYWLAGLVLYRWIDPPATPLMLWRWALDGAEIDRHSVPLEAVAPAVLRSLIAAEDARFCQHQGVDFAAVQDALEEYQEEGRLRGASTMTMQLARNLFLGVGGGPVLGGLRKVLELPFALAIDALWPKWRIAEMYLQVAEWGDGVYGIEAAAQRAYGIPTHAVSYQQAARLVAVLPNPRRWSAAAPTPYLQRRAETIARRAQALDAGLIACALSRHPLGS